MGEYGTSLFATMPHLSVPHHPLDQRKSLRLSVDAASGVGDHLSILGGLMTARSFPNGLEGPRFTLMRHTNKTRIWHGSVEGYSVRFPRQVNEEIETGN